MTATLEARPSSSHRHIPPANALVGRIHSWLEPFTILVTIGKPLSVLEAIRMRQDDLNWARRNKWTSSAFLGFCTFFADAVSPESHYPGAYVEAALTGIGAFVFSLVIVIVADCCAGTEGRQLTATASFNSIGTP